MGSSQRKHVHWCLDYENGYLSEAARWRERQDCRRLRAVSRVGKHSTGAAEALPRDQVMYDLGGAWFAVTSYPNLTLFKSYPEVYELWSIKG